MNTSEPKSPSLPRELLHTIFSLSEPGPNATYLSEVCRDWRDVYKELLYSTITIFDKETVKEYEHGCIDYSVYYYLMNDDQKHGVSLEKEDKGNGKTWVQLDLLCRTLSESNGHLASYVQKIDFCAKVKGYTYFLPIAYLCRNVTHLCLRGQLEHDNSLHSSVKMAVKSLSSLRVLQSEGFFPGFSMPDVVPYSPVARIFVALPWVSSLLLTRPDPSLLSSKLLVLLGSSRSYKNSASYRRM